jgi:hypothetical protein
MDWSPSEPNSRLADHEITRLIWNQNIRRSQGSSVSIVSDYGLDDQAIEVRYPAEAKDFSSRFWVHTGSGPYLASCTMRTGDPFLG